MGKKIFIDQMGRQAAFSFPPKRIISLVPSQTELLADLDLDQEVIGITKFCIHPDHWYRSKIRVGGTKDFNPARIAELRPDLIIGNKEENEQDRINTLAIDFPVWMSDIHDLEDALEMIRSVGDICDRKNQANNIADRIISGFSDITLFSPVRTAYFIWQNPWMVAAAGTFIHSILCKIGLVNVFADQDRYPEIDPKILKEKDPELILLSSEPFPFREKHIRAFQEICPKAVIKLVDGEIFSWYGSRLLKATTYYKSLRKSILL